MDHDCREELHSADLRVTPARLGVLDALEHAEEPMDVATVVAYLQKHRINADEATVFRILRKFFQKGLVKTVQFNEGKQRFEYAAKPSHHHFVCDNCGKIIDVTGCLVEQMEKTIEKKHGVKVAHHSLEFFGTCKHCNAL